MNLDALGASPVGQLVPITGNDQRTGGHYDYWAYLPDPLPAGLSLTSSTWTAVARAEAALARLDQAGRQVPRPELLRQPSLRREAQSTSALEGTLAPIEDVLGSELEHRESASVEVREILNYVAAAEEGFAWVRERPLTTGLLGGLQQVLVRGTLGEYSDAGSVRDRQVVIGARGSTIAEARFIPPAPGDHLEIGLREWVDWVNAPPVDLPAVVQAALAHYQFETLHPFSDGNGRIGRLVIALQLMRQQVLQEPLLVVSPWLQARRQQYQDGLLRLSTTGDWDAWVGFFVNGVEASANGTRERIDRLQSWQAGVIARVRRAGVTGVAERVAGELIGSPVLRASQVARQHEISAQGAMKALRRLAGMGIVDERVRDGRVAFVAAKVVELVGS
jgi:Fic family protein